MDDKGLVDLANLRENIKKADFEGKSSFCFHFGDKLVKVYARKADKGFYLPPDVSKIVDFTGFFADTINFPLEYIYENGKKAGEILSFVNSKSLHLALTDNIRVDKLIVNYEGVLSDLNIYRNIDMIDLCFVNILYSNRNGFTIIDTTDWNLVEDALKINIHRLNSSIIGVLVRNMDIPYCICRGYICVDSLFLDNLKKYGHAGLELIDSLNSLSEDKYNFLKMIFSYLDIYHIHYNKDANTLKDVKELTKILKKG